MGISVFVITLNEEKRIGRALNSVTWANERIVVDGGSGDHTVQICKEKNAKVFSRTFDNFEFQKNYALSLTQSDWVLSLDADEVVSEALRDEILKTVSSSDSFAGYRIKRQNHFLGKALNFGRQGNDRALRLFRKKSGAFEGLIHEKVCVTGAIGNLKNVLEHSGTETLKDYFSKLKLYTDLEAERVIAEHRVPSLAKAAFYPLAMWLLDYVIRGGFLDGWHGFLYHGLSCYYGWVKNFKARGRSLQKSAGVTHL